LATTVPFLETMGARFKPQNHLLELLQRDQRIGQQFVSADYIVGMRRHRPIKLIAEGAALLMVILSMPVENYHRRLQTRIFHALERGYKSEHHHSLLQTVADFLAPDRDTVNEIQSILLHRFGSLGGGGGATNRIVHPVLFYRLFVARER
jgi:hypothetical protein